MMMRASLSIRLTRGIGSVMASKYRVKSANVSVWSRGKCSTYYMHIAECKGLLLWWSVADWRYEEHHALNDIADHREMKARSTIVRNIQ